MVGILFFFGTERERARELVGIQAERMVRACCFRLEESREDGQTDCFSHEDRWSWQSE